MGLQQDYVVAAKKKDGDYYYIKDSSDERFKGVTARDREELSCNVWGRKKKRGGSITVLYDGEDDAVTLVAKNAPRPQ